MSFFPYQDIAIQALKVIASPKCPVTRPDAIRKVAAIVQGVCACSMNGYCVFFSFFLKCLLHNSVFAL